ncbi:MAG: hypothetical protein Q9217_007048, partial [Psora testacea]
DETAIMYPSPPPGPRPTFSIRTSSSFTSTVRPQIEAQPNRNICWNCGDSPTQICHVLSRAEREVVTLEKRGFLPADFLGSFQNSVLLCPTCHANFDDLLYPGFIFIPHKLGYFIKFEEQDFEERQRMLNQEGRLHVRSFPTKEQYQLECVATVAGDIELDPASFEGGISASRFPRETRDDLWRLTNLYDDNDRALQEINDGIGARLASTSGSQNIEPDPATGGPSSPRRSKRHKPPQRSEPPASKGTAAGEGSRYQGNQQRGINSDVQTADGQVSQTTKKTPTSTNKIGDLTQGRLSRASTLGVIPLKLTHALRCRQGSPFGFTKAMADNFESSPCRACEVEYYASQGIQYLPSYDNWPKSMKEAMKYPGLRPELPPKAEKPVWRYGPESTSQEVIERQLQVKIGINNVNKSRGVGRQQRSKKRRNEVET